MMSFGEAPYLECSSKGDKRFSAFYARVERNGIRRSIEDWYQRAKILDDGSRPVDWRDGKGKVPRNVTEVRELYRELWILYFNQNPDLLAVIAEYKGFTDIFGQPGHACQAEEIYRIWTEINSGLDSTKKN